ACSTPIPTSTTPTTSTSTSGLLDWDDITLFGQVAAAARAGSGGDEVLRAARHADDVHPFTLRLLQWILARIHHGEVLVRAVLAVVQPDGQRLLKGLRRRVIRLDQKRRLDLLDCFVELAVVGV